MKISTLSDNLQRINERIEYAAVKAGRNADEITLVAVTKYVDAEVTKCLVEAGQSILGESRPQLLWEKAEALSGKNVEWHLIGHLQRNKINRTLPYCNLVHSVDSLRLLDSINSHSQRENRVCDCLLEINISGEASKHGLQPSEVESVLEGAINCSHVSIKGLMGMASLAGSEEDNRREFSELRKLLDKHKHLNSNNIVLDELSMGMSGDFEMAIAEGSTIVRIGSLLFEGT